jgi:hypothetical protein
MDGIENCKNVGKDHKRQALACMHACVIWPAGSAAGSSPRQQHHSAAGEADQWVCLLLCSCSRENNRHVYDLYLRNITGDQPQGSQAAHPRLHASVMWNHVAAGNPAPCISLLLVRTCHDARFSCAAHHRWLPCSTSRTTRPCWGSSSPLQWFW